MNAQKFSLFILIHLVNLLLQSFSDIFTIPT